MAEETTTDDSTSQGIDQPSKATTKNLLSSPSKDESYPNRLIRLAISNNILRFGEFQLKSGRSSPYFYNAGLYNTGLLLNAIGLSYAKKIVELREGSGRSGTRLEFDVLFGPAYKGIPLAAITAVELNRIDPLNFKSIGVAYNRKEAKTHGEGGSVVGSSLKDKRVLILDDVITAGTAIRESIEIIRKESGKFVGVIVNLDRQERVSNESDRSAIEIVEDEFGVKVYSVIKLVDIIEFMKSSGGFDEEILSMETYRQEWGINQIQS